MTHGSGELTQDINILPLIDVLLVLLIIYLLMLRGLTFIPAQIPPAAAKGAGERPGPQIVLELRADGSYAINQQPIPAAQLAAQLHAIYDGRPTKLLFIAVADERPYNDAIVAMDLAREVGIQALAWVPRTAPPHHD